MSRTRMAVVLVIVGAAIVLVIAAATSDNPVDELEKKVVALQQRVDSMEKQLQALRLQVAQAAAGGGTDTAALDAEAQKAYAEITTLVNAGKIDEAKKRLAEDRKKYARSRYARQLVSMATELEVVGKTSPPDWGIEKWYQGEDQIDLASSKTTLVVFWEEWCPHCRREVPKMEQIYQNLKGDGLQLVGLTKINKSATEEKVLKFLADQKVGYPVAKEDGQASQHFGVRGIPAAAVVKDGKVIWRGHPARLTETQLKGWL